ncbi:MAG: SDR family NAD(P)-dependent oxidoreductase [Ktedonobacterales bacterium]|nr:SDR family NAD(P)-dependent oxidoreductase [Ktedonobacterales bacterium]
MGNRARGVAWAALGAVGAGAALAAGRRVWRQTRAMDLAGSVVLITGSSRGLGLALAREFARQGARLVICGRDEAALERARADLAGLGAEVLAVPCNITDRMQVQAMIEQAIAHFGRLDVLVNNAGIITVGPLESMILEDFELAMETMFWGGAYAALAALPHLVRGGGGRIVNITSIGGKVSVPHLLPYSCAKFAMVGFSEGLRAEVAKDGVRVVTVAPGLMRTGSPVNASFKGRHRAEYTWFSLGDNLPFTSMSAERAARQIVAATRRGDAEVILSVQARLLALAHGVLPGVIADALGIVNQLLPKAGDIGQDALPGAESETPLTRSFLSALGRRAEQVYYQRVPTTMPGSQPSGPAASEFTSSR